MSAGNIDFVFLLWVASLAPHGDQPPFLNARFMYKTIDATPLGDIPWESFTLQYNGTQPTENVLSWMTAEHDIWFQDPHVLVHNILSNATFESSFDYAPFQEHAANGMHHFCDFMSGNWAWMQVVHFHYRLLKKYSFG